MAARDPAGQPSAVRAWLHDQGILAVSDEWLDACVDHVTQSFGRAPPAADLRRLVLDQWLDTDLATLGVAALPPRLAGQALVTLRRPCAVQLLSAVDVSQPAHGQLLKLRRLDSANTKVGEPRAAWEQRPSRALRLTLSDGVQQVTALECEPLPALRPDAPAGLKLVLRPPLECRRGVLLLAAESVRVLGGAVEELADPRAEQRVLEERLGAAAAGLPAEPTGEDSGYRSDQAAGAPRGRPAPEPDPFDDGLDEAELAAIDIPDDDIDDAELAALEIPGEEAGAGDSVSAFSDVDDAELASLDLDSLVDSAVDRATAPEPAPAPVKRRRTEPWGADGPAAPQCRAPRSRDARGGGSAGRARPAHRQQRLDAFVRSGAPPTPPTERACFAAPAPPAASALSQRTAAHAASPVRTAPSFDLSSWLEPEEPEQPPPPAPFGYLSELQPGRPLTVKAFIMTMLDSLNLAGGQWRLGVKINDGTRSADAMLSDAVLAGMIGLTATEAVQLRTDGRTDPAVRARLMRSLGDAQTAIIRLSCLMRLEAGDAPDQLPVITELTEVGEETLRALSACVGTG